MVTDAERVWLPLRGCAQFDVWIFKIAVAQTKAEGEFRVVAYIEVVAAELLKPLALGVVFLYFLCA